MSDREKLEAALREILSETEQVSPQSALSPAMKRIQAKARAALAEPAAPEIVGDVEDARGAYYNLRTCGCGADAMEHRCPDPSNEGDGFDPGWSRVRADLEARQMRSVNGPWPAAPEPPRFRRTIVCAACAMEDDEPLVCDSPGCDGQPRFVTAEWVAPLVQPLSPAMLDLTDKALVALERWKGEDLREWAERLGRDIDRPVAPEQEPVAWAGAMAEASRIIWNEAVHSARTQSADPERADAAAVLFYKTIVAKVAGDLAAPPDSPSEPSAEVENLRGALDELMEPFREGGLEPDFGDFERILTKRGLLVEVPADEAFKAEWDTDTMLVLAWHAPPTRQESDE